MKKFENVSVDQKANSYFEGKVSSRTVYLENGERITLGFMCPGEYEFGTAKKEKMEIVAGEMLVLLPESTEWEMIEAGHSFYVPADSSFKVKTTTFADYTCYYLD